MKKIKLYILIMATTFAVSAQGYSQTTVLSTPAAVVQQQTLYTNANSLDVVASPAKYLNKQILVKGKFDKFSTLGLDYTAALRSSEKYITFLIQRDDVKDHDVPLSEMKIFLKRTEAEKHIDLSPGDEIEFAGKVFSNALGDVWMDAEKFTVLSQKKKEEIKK